MDKDGDYSTSESTILSFWRAAKNGCDACGNVGYKGRIGIYEVLSNTRDVQKLIVSNATSSNIQDQAIKDGMVTMQIDGLVKALRGQTTVEEVLRATKES